MKFARTAVAELVVGFLLLGTLETAVANDFSVVEAYGLQPEIFIKNEVATVSDGDKSFGPWRVLVWQNNVLEVLPFKGFSTRPAPYNWHEQLAPKKFERVPDVPKGALMRVRLSQAKGNAPPDLSLRLGKAEGLAIGEIIRDGWLRRFELSDQAYTLVADYVQGPDGKVLPGSMRLSLRGSDNTPTQVVLGRTPGVIFREQRVLWAGYLTQYRFPDFLIQRTLLTGEKGYTLALAHADGHYAEAEVLIDEDLHESHIDDIDCAFYLDDLAEIVPRPYPMYRRPTTAHYAQSATRSVHSLEVYAPGNLIERKPAPGALSDMKFTYKGKIYRILLEMQPVYSEAPVNAQSQVSTDEPDYWRHWLNRYAAVLSLFHKGMRQVLLVSTKLDELSVSLTAGELDESGLFEIAVDSSEGRAGSTMVWVEANESGRIMRRKMELINVCD